jgi:alpha-beta hydrolase superfamily lysophospholipase
MKPLLVLLALVAQTAWADIVPVPVDPDQLGWFDRATPTLTWTQPAQNPKGTILVIMGGEGRIGLEQGERVTVRPTVNMLRPLIAQGYNLVVFDSPYELFSATDMGQPRYATDHQRRIDEVVTHYRTQYGFPVWLFGHSAGAVSVAQYANRVHSDANKIAGVIVSGEHQRTSFDVRMTVPVLILHHEADPCPRASPYMAQRQYERVSRNTTSRVELVWIQGGDSSGTDCRDGYHMYKGRLEQAAGAIAGFMQ